jgi:hypothetical protein
MTGLLDRDTTGVEDVTDDLKRYAGPVLAAASVITDLASAGTPISLLGHLTEAYETGEALGHTAAPVVELLTSGVDKIESAVAELGHGLPGDGGSAMGDSSTTTAFAHPEGISDGTPDNGSHFGAVDPFDAGALHSAGDPTLNGESHHSDTQQYDVLGPNAPSF